MRINFYCKKVKQLQQIFIIMLHTHMICFMHAVLNDGSFEDVASTN